ncbi:MAG: CoA pyrophosphatase [Gammaproteobacteria bacterium]|nr:CoA pyrophosphatase [Gammaproteobacteria bacterium]
MHQPIATKLRTLEPTWSQTYAELRGTFSDYDFEPTGEFSPRGQTKPGKRPLKLAAVLVPLVHRDTGYHVLLTQRTDHLNDHAGQISFPGGRAEAEDESPTATALREAEEEVGLTPPYVEVLGHLDTYETRSGYLVIPVVAAVREGFTLARDEFEVAEVFEVPLDFILSPDNRQVHTRTFNGAPRTYFVYEYGPRYIWGATAGMLSNLVERLGS